MNSLNIVVDWYVFKNSREYLTKNIKCARNFVLVGEKSEMFIGEDFLVPVVTSAASSNFFKILI